MSYLCLFYNKKLWGLSLASALWSATVHSTHKVNEEDFFTEFPVVITATRLPQTVMDAPASVTVLEREDVEASGFTSIGDLFRLVPGFQVALGWRDHHTAVTYHGQSDGLSRRMQVLIDGRVAFTSIFGLSDWDRLGITVQDVERIEVVRGPVGSAFGSNAFIAAINIVTRDPASTEGWSATTSVATDETYSVSSRYSELGDDYEYTIGASYLDSDGFEHSNNEIEVTNLRLYGRNQLNSDWLVDYQISHSQGPTGRGGAIPIVDPVGEKDVQEDYGQIRFTNTSQMHKEWYVEMSYSRSRESDRNYAGTLGDILDSEIVTETGDYLLPLPFLSVVPLDHDVYISTYDLHADRVMFDGQQTLVINHEQRIVWGGGIQESRNKVHHEGKVSEYKTDFMANLHTNWEYRLGGCLLNAGLMFEDGDLADANISYRLGVNYDLADNHLVRVSVAQGWRTPFVGEAYQKLALETVNGFPVEKLISVPENLNPEKISSIELGYVSDFFQGALTVDAKIFHEKLSHEIQEVINFTVPELISLFSPGEIQRVNGGETTIDGFEAGMVYHTNTGFRMLMSYAYADVDQDLSAFTLPILPFRGLNQYEGTPTHTGSLLLSQKFKHGWSGSVGFYHLDDMGWYLWGDDIDSYDRIDVRIAKQFQIGRSDVKVELIGQNLGDSYHEFETKNKFDTEAILRITVDF